MLYYYLVFCCSMRSYIILLSIRLVPELFLQSHINVVVLLYTDIYFL